MPIFTKRLEIFEKKYYNIYTHTCLFKIIRKENLEMSFKKIPYENASIDIILIGCDDIVTTSTAQDNFDFVDQNAWDS